MLPAHLIAALVVATLLVAPDPAAAQGPGAGGGSSAASASKTVPFETRAKDGTALRGHVYLPKGAGGPVGTVLNLSPYWNTLHGIGLSTDSQRDGALNGGMGALLKAGFAVALVNYRGTGISDGCFGFSDRRDIEDAGTIVEALAALDHANGKVGMYGGSFHGWSAYLAAAARPPSLAAIAPFSAVQDYWALGSRQGAVYAPAPAVISKVDFETTLGATDPAVLDHAKCTQANAEHSTAYAELQRTGDRTSYWRDRDLRSLLEKTPVPTFMANGLDYAGEGHIGQFEGLWDRLEPSRTRFLLGQWSHDFPSNHREDYHDQLVAWFDEHLRGGASRLPTGIVEFQDDAGEWHHSRRWPPPSTPEALTLSTDGRLVASRDAAKQGTSSFDSVPTSGERACGPHQVVYASEPTDRARLIAGNYRLRATLESSQRGGNLVTTLYRTAGTGTCSDLSGAKFLGRSEMDLRHRNDTGTGEDTPVGAPFEVEARSHPLVAKVPEGQRLVLVVGAGSDQIVADEQRPRIGVRSGGTLELPVVTGDAERTVPAPSGRTGPAAPGATGGGSAAMPEGRRCTSRRRFAITLRDSRGRSLRSARVRVNGGRVAVKRRRGRLVALVDLRGLRRGRYTVRVEGRTRGGRRVSAKRRYRTCGSGTRSRR